MAAGRVLASRYPRRGGVQVSELQRSRMLTSVVQVVSEHGYGELSVTRVTSRARVSRRTFYELFENREECFLAAFDEAVAEMRRVAASACEGQRGWREQTRAGLAALLLFLDEQRAVGQVVVVQALGAGPRVLQRRAEVLRELSQLIDAGRGQSSSRREPPPLTAEGVVGAVLSLVHARLLEPREGPLIDLLNPLMGMILAPYLGQAAASRELERRQPAPVSPPVSRPTPLLTGLNMRLTYRTLRVLSAIAASPGASNREVAVGAEVADQGQISKLLARLVSLGLVSNNGEGHARGERNAWRLTPRGEELQSSIHAEQPAPWATSVVQPR